jgi:methionyl-tRNA formyltransferase
MRAVVVGAVESSRVAVDAIARAADWALPLVVTLPRERAGRHSDFVDLTEAAERAGASLLRAANVNDPAVIDAITAAGATHLFVIGWSQICGADVRAAAGGGTIGYHPAPLPRLRGRGVIPWTILAGEPITAGTLFWIDDGVDSGPILDQRLLHVAPDETAATLYARHMTALDAMLADTLAAIAAGRARREPQDERFATWAARRTPADGEIDWTRPAHEIDRLVRAVGRPYPGARTGPLTIWAARPSGLGERYLAGPGQIVARDGPGFTVACGASSALDILEWESADGAMPRMHARLGASR